MDLVHFPSLSSEEFFSACHYFDMRYYQAELGSLSQHWKLRLRTVLRPEFALDGNPPTYVQITKVLEAPEEVGIDLSSLSLSEDEQSLAADQELMDLEASDQVASS